MNDIPTLLASALRFRGRGGRGLRQCLQVETVSCRRWKQDLQLNGKGKEGSRQLAIRLFPTASELLKCDLTLAKPLQLSRSWHAIGDKGQNVGLIDESIAHHTDAS